MEELGPLDIGGAVLVKMADVGAVVVVLGLGCFGRPVFDEDEQAGLAAVLIEFVTQGAFLVLGGAGDGDEILSQGLFLAGLRAQADGDEQLAMAGLLGRKGGRPGRGNGPPLRDQSLS